MHVPSRNGWHHNMDANSLFVLLYPIFCSVCCPYPLVAIPALISFVAFIFTWVAATSCNFYSITYTEATDVGVGLWTVETIYATEEYGEHHMMAGNVYCTAWGGSSILTYDDIDAALKTARAFGIIGGVLATIAFVVILIPSCVVFDAGRNNYILMVCGICVFTGIATLLDLVSPVKVRNLASVCSKPHAPTCFNRLPWRPTFAKVQVSVRLSQPVSYR